eukprot:531377-Pelagomonas_calceolata.AAC.6
MRSCTTVMPCKVTKRSYTTVMSVVQGHHEVLHHSHIISCKITTRSCTTVLSCEVTMRSCTTKQDNKEQVRWPNSSMRSVSRTCS